MLNSLIINNIVIINQAQINFGEGLCVLTGETGSGKSILLDALGLAIGSRSSTRMIGNFANKAEVFAEFNITENLICQKILEENSLVDEDNGNKIIRIRRIIFENSTNKVFVNDHQIGVNLLNKIGETLVEINGQHEQFGLLNQQTHLTILDEFANNTELLVKLKNIYQQLKNIDQKIIELENQASQASKDQDYLIHIIKELSDANVKENEEQQLVNDKESIISQQKILNFLTEFKNNLNEALTFLISSQKILLRNSNLIDNNLKDFQESFNKFNEDCEIKINDFEKFINFINSSLKIIANRNFDRDAIEERLFMIRNLARKFSVNSNDLSRIIDESREKLTNINNSSDQLLNLKKQKTEVYQQYQKIAKELSSKRQKSAKILAQKVEEELKFLKMTDTKFLVKFFEDNKNSKNDSFQSYENYSLNGLDRVCFQASTNNNNFDEIIKIASGGELSRFMLALKVALIDVKSTPTIIFDEIDTGISGSTAQAVGKRLKTLAQKLQILVVTHQAQIASKADTHFKISKKSYGQNTDKKFSTIIEKLSIEQSEKEIARMLSGEEISDEAILVAKNLINS